MLFDNITDAIGHTPIVRLRPDGAGHVEVYAKLEMQNLFGMKDRVGRNIILEARRLGVLRDGAPIVESSSGTMALGVALVGRSLGHEVHIVTDPRIDTITMTKLRSLGCEVHVVSAMSSHGWQSARIERLERLMAELPGAFWPQQYANPDNPGAYALLAQEILDDLGPIDVLVGSVGSGGSLCGTSRALRRTLPGLQVVGVDCVGSALFGQPDRPKRLQSGLGNSLRPKNLDRRLIDEVHWLNDHEAFAATRRLAREQQIFAGNTAGSVYRVLGEVAERARPGERIVGIFPDRGDRYVDTVFSDEHWAEHSVTALPSAAVAEPVEYGTEVGSWSRAQLAGSRSDPAHLLFVESNTTGTGMLALDTARRLGLRPVLLTGWAGRYPELDCEVLTCDTNSTPALRSAVQDRFHREEIAGLTTTSDFYVSTVAELAEWLGLPGNPVGAMRTCRDKAGLRAVLAASGLPQPRYVVVTDPADCAAAVASVGLPCVVKPVDDSGSNEVLLCATVDEVCEHVARVLATRHNVRGQPTAGAVLVEEHVVGPEFSVEQFSWHEEPHCVGITGKTVVGAPHFVESRHIFPAPVTDSVAAELVRTASAAVKATGFRLGPTHTELRLTARGPVVIEVNARLAGGMIPELIRLASDVDLLEQQVRAAAGLPPVPAKASTGCAGVQFVLADRPGVLRGVSWPEQLDVERVVITAAPGTEVRPPRNAYDRLGYVIATHDEPGELACLLDRAMRELTVEVAVEEPV